MKADRQLLVTLGFLPAEILPMVIDSQNPFCQEAGLESGKEMSSSARGLMDLLGWRV